MNTNDYRQSAIKLLNMLRQTNYVPNNVVSPFTQADEDIIDAIVSECKSTVISPQVHRYESDITKSAVKEIVKELIKNGDHISKDVMNKFIVHDNLYMGVDKDVHLYKGIDSERGTYEAIMENPVVDLRNYQSRDMDAELDKLYEDYAREMVLEDCGKSKKDRRFPPQSPLVVFKEKFFHKKFKMQDFEKRYKGVLAKYTGITNKATLDSSAKFMTRYMYSDIYRNKIAESITNGTSISVVGSNEKSFEQLCNQIKINSKGMYANAPSMQMVARDVTQIFHDINAELTAYATDLRGLTPEQIETELKEINKISLSSQKAVYMNQVTGYRNVDVGFSANDDGAKLLRTNGLKQAMNNLTQEIADLVNSDSNGNKLSDLEYLRKASDLTYRFIRIHPFPDSNGRTSRALLNMMTLNRGILVPFSKESKVEYTQAMNRSHEKVGFRSDEYLDAIVNEPEKAAQMESKGANDIFRYIIKSAKYEKKMPSDTNFARTQAPRDVADAEK